MAKMLAEKQCREMKSGEKGLSEKAAAGLLREVKGWKIENGELVRTFDFKDYHESVGFVNATAWVSNAENHHPDIELGYNKVKMRYSTHSVGGLSENDFICAAKVSELVG